MPQTCPKCRRANPPEAQYCYEDGFALGGRAAGPVDPGSQPFPHPFVFPDGRGCRNFNELALGCFQEWTVGVQLLHDGDLANFLAGLGRADLAKAAREAARFPDKDRALDYLLGQLPAHTLEPARLRVEPLQVNLGRLAVGKDSRWVLLLENQGMRLLSGSVASDCLWLSLGDAVGSPRKVFQFGQSTIIPVHVRGKELRAGAKALVGRLTVESNGGNTEVVVTADVPVKPFPDGALAGAISPRQVAERARAHPKAAAALFENGAVVRWYQDNGWIYPVEGPSASGLGAVQQFFEALGLTKPPKVELRESAIQFSGKVGEEFRRTLEATTPENRPIFAHAVSDQPWLKVNRVILDGRTAAIRLSAVAPERPGETLHARLTVKANGNQRFVVPVTLAVAGTPRPIEPMTYQVVEVLDEVAEPATQLRAAPDTRVKRAPVALRTAVLNGDEEESFGRKKRRRGLDWFVILPVVFLVVGLSVALIHDLIARIREEWTPPPAGVIALEFHDKDKTVPLGPASGGGIKGGGSGPTEDGIWDASMRFGLVMTNEKDPRNPTKRKRLTFEEEGLTNNTVVKLDGGEWIFGEKPFHTLGGKVSAGEYPGRWVEREGNLGRNADGEKRAGRRSVWYYDKQNVQVTQTVELVVGDLSGQIDTCMVHYRIENQDSKPHRVGLRFLLDTYIGANDGVPFLIPGQNRLIDDKIDERDPNKVPQYIQACENEDLNRPGTIARIQFRVAGLEPPSRVTLGAWPDPQLAKIDPIRGRACLQEKTLWEVPVFPIKQMRSEANPNGDSAVVMYWPEKELKPGESRDVGFAYGLGDVSSSGGKLGLTAGGSFSPGGEITVTAYVTDPAANETVTLTAPPGFLLKEGDATQHVPPLPAGATSRHSPVSWKLTCGQVGDFTLKVETASGASQSKKVTVKAATIFGSN
jgi:hypothetical protein